MPPMDLESTFHGSVTVGERGQVVIPASVRERMGISPGDKLLVFAHPGHHGVLFARLQDLQRMTEMLGPILEAADDTDSAPPPGRDPEATSQGES